jgi:hypothetical protein
MLGTIRRTDDGFYIVQAGENTAECRRLAAMLLGGTALPTISLLGALVPAANKIPYFTGTASADLLTLDTDPTLSANSNTRIAPQQAIKAYVDSKVTGLLDDKGPIDCSANPNYPAASKGDVYRTTVAGKIGGASGKSVDVGDLIIASADNAGGTEAAAGSNWYIIEHNLINAALLSGATFTGPVLVPDDAYDATGWNGSVQVPTKNAIRDKIEDLAASASLFIPEQIILMPISNSTSLTAIGTSSITTNLGAAAYASTNYVTKCQRLTTTTSTAANSGAYITTSNTAFYGLKGCQFKIRWGIEVALSDGRYGVGAGWPSGLTSDPSGATNVIGMGKDAADTNMQIMHNDASGACTKIDLGSNFPATVGVAYDLDINYASGGASATYKVTRLDSAQVASGTISTNLPATTQVCAIGVNIGTGTVTASPAAPKTAFMGLWAKSNL